MVSTEEINDLRSLVIEDPVGLAAPLPQLCELLLIEAGPGNSLGSEAGDRI